jgi:hypothetical protein
VFFIGQQGQASCQKSWQFEILSGAAKKLLVLRVTEIGRTRRQALKRAFYQKPAPCFGAPARVRICHTGQNVWETGKFCDPFEAPHNSYL